jgi:hypothetical protein
MTDTYLARVPAHPSPQGDPNKPEDPPATRYLTCDLADIPLAHLIDLHTAIKCSLPNAKLQDINLAQELVLQFMRVKELQTATLSDTKVAANQKAQVANSVAATLAQLTKLQTELHTAERLKTIEGILIRHLKTLPVEVVEAFLEEYGQMEATG